MKAKTLPEIDKLIQKTKDKLSEYNRQRTELIKNWELYCTKCNKFSCKLRDSIRYGEYRSVPYEDYGEVINRKILCPECLEAINVPVDFDKVSLEYYINRYLERDLYPGYNKALFRYYKDGAKDSDLLTYEKFKDILKLEKFPIKL